MEPADVDVQALAPGDAIVLLIAALDETDPLALPVLHDTVDPDALDRVVETGDSLRISFSYADHDVAVGPEGIEIDGVRYG